jgi:N-acetylglucosaminyl-diphospho-decaprenol L-rhamnosyltransferase
MATSLDIIIVNWNTKAALGECLRSIEASQSDEIDLQRVVVVDNGSFDDSLSGLGEIGLPLQIHRNSSNRGFAAGCNQGVRGTKADYLLFLNPDTHVNGRALSEPINLMKQPQNSALGICGIQLLDDRGLPTTSSARFPTLNSIWLEGMGLHRLALRHFAPRHQSDLGSEIEVVDQVIGAFFLIRRSVYDLLNGFDERFFVYFEEVDLSLRARIAGYSSCVLGYVTANHTGCVSSDQVKGRRLFYYWRSRLLYANKHFAWLERYEILILTFVVEPSLRLLQAAVFASMDGLLVTAQAYGYLIHHSLFGKRGDYAR